MEQYRHHIFVCLGKRCSDIGSEEVLNAFKSRIKAEGLSGEVIVSRSGCIRVCKETRAEGEYSPVVVIYPEGTWYRNVSDGDVEEIISRHIKGGEPVERLLHYRLRHD